MLNIFWQKIKEQYRGVIYYALGIFAYLWLLISMFPTMKTTNLDQIIEQMPKEMIKFMGGTDTLKYSTIEGFLSLEYLSLFFILIVIFYLGASAGSAIAGNREKHLTDFDLSQPISRTKYALGQFFVTAIYTIFLAVFNSIAIFVLCRAYDVTINSRGLWSFTLLASFFLLAWVGISALLSSLLKTKTAVTLATAGLALASYILFSLAGVVEKLKDYDKYSIFYLYNPQRVIAEGKTDIQDIIILLFVFLAGITLSVLIFNKKDL